MHKVITRIDDRIEQAKKGCRHTDDWDDSDCGAPYDMCYNDWIDEALNKASEYINHLEQEITTLTDARVKAEADALAAQIERDQLKAHFSKLFEVERDETEYGRMIMDILDCTPPRPIFGRYSG